MAEQTLAELLGICRINFPTNAWHLSTSWIVDCSKGIISQPYKIDGKAHRVQRVKDKSDLSGPLRTKGDM